MSPEPRPSAEEHLLHAPPAAAPAEPATTADAECTGPHIPERIREIVGAIPRIPGYEVLDVIAHGGMGYVLKGRDATLHRLAAIKLPLTSQMTPAERERFLREARAAAGLRHPNICAIHRVDVAEDGTPFIAMEYLAGRSLLEVIRERRPAPREAAALLATLARAVGYAHEHRIIHRDLKPANVMVLAENGQPVLTDFGLAKELGSQGAEVTRSGQVMGTPAFMAPEQAAGRVEQVGPPADIYALGAILYQMLTGQPPFQGAVGEVLGKVQNEEPVPPRRLVPRIHRDLETICLKCLAKRPEERYASALLLAEDLERFAGGEPILARRTAWPVRLARKVRRRPVLAAIGALLLLAAAGGALAGGYFYLEYSARDQLAHRANDREIAFQAELDRAVQSDTWAGEELDELERGIEELSALAPPRGQEAHRKLLDALLAGGENRLQKKTPQEQDFRHAERLIALLRTRDAPRADRLHKVLQGRLRDWLPVFRLAPPGEGRAVFSARAKPAVRFQDDGVLLDTPDAAGEFSRYLTDVPCRGNVMLEASFAPGWERAGSLGLILNQSGADPAAGYNLVLRPNPLGRSGPHRPSFAQARQERSDLVLEIHRNGRLIGQDAVSSAIADGPLLLRFWRVGDQVRAQVNELPALVHQDLFPLPGRGVFGVIGSRGVLLRSLEGKRQALPVASSLLERGDELFLAGKLAEALAFYQQQAVRSAGSAVGHEARFKEGVTLMRLNRLADAVEHFQRLYGDSIPTWSPLAGCYLLALYVRRNEMDRAIAFFDMLSVDFAREGIGELAARLPADVRGVILKGHRLSSGGFGLLRHDPRRVEKIERLARIEEVMHVSPVYRGWTRLALVRALRVEPNSQARHDAARRILDWLKDDYPPHDSTTPFGLLLAAEYGWLMREAGTPRLALEEIDQRLFVKAGTYRREYLPLLLERARLHVALKQPEQAEKDLEEYFRATPAADRHARTVAEASLMLGLLREQRGDHAGARQAWLQGRSPRSLADPALFGDTAGMIGALTMVALEMLCDSLKDEEADRLMRNYLKTQAGGTVLLLLVRKDDTRLAAQVARKNLRMPQGRQLLRDFAFQSLSFRDYYRRPILFAGKEGLREVLFGGAAGAEQEAILSQVVEATFQAFSEGRLSGTQLVQLAFTLRGSRDRFNWGRLEKALPPAQRGPLAYLLGVRFLGLNRRSDAAAFFRTAVADAAPGSAVNRLAAAELERLKGK